ncbi:hypothetical protein ABZ897_20845 [Nonomuraea sp. NPDC046802]|uniref:hypothetical protein n=1 Tax=Nonomuraea sp. NPDC046802 TaxID=3154919 RepID=UPI00340FEA3D
MTWLRDVLVDLAAESPRVDLAERTIATRDHRRRTAISLLAAATVVVTALGGTLAVRLLPQAPTPATSGKDDLPARGVGPLSHAYKSFCKSVSGKAPSNCQDGGWRVVTRSGRTYHVPEALPSLSLRNSPLAISRDGRKIAYYSAKEGTFQVRDLASGAKTTAPMKLPPKKWLYSITRLMVSDDGRFVAFSKVPEFKDPALLFDMRDRVVRELPARWVPIGLSPDGATITLAEYSPNSQLRTISNLWPPTSPGNSTAVILPQHYAFSPLAPDGKTVAAVEDHSTAKKPCQMGDLVLLDPLTGKKRKTVPIRGLSADVSTIYLRTWRSADEVTALTTSVRCRPSSEVPDDETAPPYQTFTAYAVNVRTGEARKLTTFRAQDIFGIAMPGPPGAI